MADTHGGGSGPEGPETGTCTNCGGADDGLSSVRRVYVTVDDTGRIIGSETMTPTESWCVACRTLYPHQPVSGDGDRRDGPPPGPGES